MNEKILSSTLKEYLSLIIGKDIESINTNDLNGIKTLALKKRNFNAEETDCNISDLIELKNLTSCTLCDFDIDNDAIENINKIEKLDFIHFDFCNVTTENMELNLNIEDACFNMCNGLTFKKMQNTKLITIELIGSEEEMPEIDISELVKADNLKELSIHNYTIKNVDKIIEIAPELESLNIDGSIVDKEKLENIKDKIEVSHKEKFYLGEDLI